jgi:hypothetical protein
MMGALDAPTWMRDCALPGFLDLGADITIDARTVRFFAAAWACECGSAQLCARLLTGGLDPACSGYRMRYLRFRRKQ